MSGDAPTPRGTDWSQIGGDDLYEPRRVSRVYPFLHDVFRRHGPVGDVLDLACGTFAIDWPLVRRGYRVVGRDRSDAMLAVARSRLQRSGRPADVARGDMRTARVPGTFDAVLCLGTAFNYLAGVDANLALRNFRRHLRPEGILVLDPANFDAWIRQPTNARAETDVRTRDGRRITVFAYNDQDLGRRITSHASSRSSAPAHGWTSVGTRHPFGSGRNATWTPN